jgi:hypothetical protein
MLGNSLAVLAASVCLLLVPCVTHFCSTPHLPRAGASSCGVRGVTSLRWRSVGMRAQCCAWLSLRGASCCPAVGTPPSSAGGAHSVCRHTRDTQTQSGEGGSTGTTCAAATWTQICACHLSCLQDFKQRQQHCCMAVSVCYQSCASHSLLCTCPAPSLVPPGVLLCCLALAL